MAKYTQEEVDVMLMRARLDGYMDWCKETAKTYEEAFNLAKSA